MRRAWLTAMGGGLARAICAVGLIALACSWGPVRGDDPVAGTGATLLDANPPDAHLSVRGAVSLAGVAPLPLANLPVGEYGLAADGPGLPAVRGRFVLSPEGLSARPWAGPTALILPPGVVHLERGETRGWTLAGAGIAGATLAIVSEAAIRNADDKVDRASLSYAWAVSEENIAAARRSLLDATQEREDQKEIRNLWLGYLGATWLGAALEAVLLTPQPSFEAVGPEQYLVTLPRAGGAEAALRSALVPGGGQRYMGRASRGNFFFTATATLAAASVAAHDAFLEARRDQAEAQRRFDDVERESELDRARRDLEKAAERVDDKNTLRWALVGATAGVYAWNVIDAFGLGQSARIPGLTWSVAPGPDGVLMCATWSMP